MVESGKDDENIIRICFKDPQGTTNLTKIDKNLTLEENLYHLAESIGIIEYHQYGLKLIERKEGKVINCYLCEQTFRQMVHDGDFLEIAESAESVIKVITSVEREARDIGKLCTYLLQIANDNALVHQLAEQNAIERIMYIFLTIDLNATGINGCLLIMQKLLINNYINTLSNEVVTKILDIVKSVNLDVLYGLMVLTQLLYNKAEVSAGIRNKIIENTSMQTIIRYVGTNVHLAGDAIRLINAIMSSVKSDGREQFIKTFEDKCKAAVYALVAGDTKISDRLACALHILQTTLLSKHKKKLNEFMLISSVDLNITDVKHMEDEMDSKDFYKSVKSSRPSSTISYMSNRYSVASLSPTNSLLIDTPDGSVCHLTHECLLYYRSRYVNMFAVSQVEENTYEPGICITSESVMRIISKVLNIGDKVRTKDTTYLPAYFASTPKDFVHELFCRIMFLLSKMRKEMKVKNMEDYSKLLLVINKQLEIIVAKRPKTMKELTVVMETKNYAEVERIWREERQAKWRENLAASPAIRELAASYSQANEQVIFAQRISVMQHGAQFIKMPEKKFRNQFVTLKLDANKTQFHYGDSDQDKIITIDQIRHLVIGEACPHIQNNTVDKSKMDCVFTINVGEDMINFWARDNQTASYWMDGIHMLLKQKPKSNEFSNELRMLTEMDLSLQLIELQNIDIPNEPPPLPTSNPKLRPLSKHT